MRINEIASAEEQLGLWKLVSDNVWQAISTQAEQEARAKAEKAAAAKSKRSKRGGGRKSAPKSTGPVAMPSLKISAPPTPKASDAKAADAVAQPQKSAQQKAAPQGQGPLPRLGAVQAARTPPMQQVLPPQLPSSIARPQTPNTALPPVQTARPKLSARYGGLVAGDTPI
jgi:hypothetical protein